MNSVEGNPNTQLSSDNTKYNISDPLATTGTIEKTDNEIDYIL